MEAPGVDYLGVLTPLLRGTTVVNVEVSGTLRGEHYTGGLAGVAHNAVILGSHFSGTIHSKIYLIDAQFTMGGLIGSADNNLIFASSTSGKFELDGVPERNFSLGGLIGSSFRTNAVIASYANFTNTKVNLVGNLAAQAPVIIENSYAIYSADENEPAAVVGFYFKPSFQEEGIAAVNSMALTDLACPQSELDERCNLPDLLRGWRTHEDSTGQKVWNFGSSADLPDLNRDLVFDLTDSDGDGVLDLLDRFPENPAAALDFDQDGKPDVWITACETDCQEASGLTLDDTIELPTYPESPVEEEPVEVPENPVEEEPVKGGSFALLELYLLCGLNGVLLLARRRTTTFQKIDKILMEK